MQPRLDTPRLVLRPFHPGDAPSLRELAGHPAVADTTLNIPHPYEEGVAERWIAGHAEAFEAGRSADFAVTLRGGELVGSISLGLERRFDRAEMGYFIGRPYWGQGYASEAARAVIDYGFGELGLNRIHAGYFTRNPASGRVMLKVGMRAEGVARQHVKKGDRYEDLAWCAILRSEWLAGRGGG